MGVEDAQIVARAKARVGTVLKGKWTLDALIGMGGMAAVYAATHRNGARAAIKILRPEAALVPDMKARFMREGYVANKVGHPGALSILDDDVDDDETVFLVMELLEGETLDERWQREGNLDPREALVIADRVLDVLVAAHDKGVVHRDLKPGNVFIMHGGDVKVLDFGIARLGKRGLERGNTGFDTALGTPGFMSPEQARGRWDEVDAASDLFALGATLFAVLSGRQVHEADTVNEELVLAMTQPAPSLGSVTKELPETLVSLVDRALKYEKSDRFPDARAMRDALNATYEEVYGEPLSTAPRLSIPLVRMSRSVRPDAPTLAAEGDEPTSDRPSTTAPVSDESRPRATPKARTYAVAASILLATGAIGVVVVGVRGKPPADAAVAAPAGKMANAATETTARPPAPLAAGEQKTEPPASSASASPPASSSATPTASAAGPGTATRAPAPRPASAAVKPPAKPSQPAASTTAPAASAKPAGTIDIFTRRK